MRKSMRTIIVYRTHLLVYSNLFTNAFLENQNEQQVATEHGPLVTRYSRINV